MLGKYLTKKWYTYAKYMWYIVQEKQRYYWAAHHTALQSSDPIPNSAYSRNKNNRIDNWEFVKSWGEQ